MSGSGYNTTVSTYDNNGTLINTYSSSSGLPSDSGFMNIFTGVYYARKGRDGVKGGDGGQGGYVTTNTSGGLNFIKGANGENVDTYTGGSSFNCIQRYEYSEFGIFYYYNSFGGGGGAAYGNNGSNAVIWADDGMFVETKAGDGANAIIPQNVYTEYGSGGFGGNGGGGGGGAGTRTTESQTSETTEYETYYYFAGNYGRGSAGTSGINGCAIIYY